MDGEPPKMKGFPSLYEVSKFLSIILVKRLSVPVLANKEENRYYINILVIL